MREKRDKNNSSDTNRVEKCMCLTRGRAGREGKGTADNASGEIWDQGVPGK